MCCEGQKLRVINIDFGSACNQHCKYCLQAQGASAKKGDPFLFIAKFAEYAKTIAEVDTINYWGGEPLLYWDSIKTVLTEMDKLFPTVKTHRITTNGSLISDDYISFCNQNSKIATVLSLHDCELSEEQWKKNGQVNKLWLSALFRKDRPSPFSYCEEWYRIQKITGRSLPFGIYLLLAVDGVDKEYWVDRQDVDNFFYEIKHFVQPLANQGEDYCRGFMSNFVHEMRRNHNIEWRGGKCFNDATLSIDLFGNKYTCHHNTITSNLVENIFDKKIYINNCQPYKFSASNKCKTCDVFEICKGGCFLSHTHDVECYFMKKKYEYFKTIEGHIR